MTVQWSVRPARPADAGRIAEIYNEGIEDAEMTLEMKQRTPTEILELMCRPGHHLFVAEWGGTVLGWAAIYPYSEWEAFAGVGEARIYVSRESRFRGLGRILMEALLRAAQEHGHYKLVGRIPVGNEPSRRLCRSLGFREVGVHEKHGRLGDRLIDVVVVERLIPAGAAEPPSSPEGG